MVTTEVGTDVQCVEQGGRECLDLGENLRSSSSCGPDVLVVDVGDETTYWEGFGRIMPQGGQQGLTYQIQPPSGCNHVRILEFLFYNIMCPKLTPDSSY